MSLANYGIRQHVAILTLLPLLVLATGLGTFFLHVQFNDMDRDLQARGQLIARQLAASSEYGVFSNNRTFLAKAARSALQEVDVKAVIVLNAAAEVMVAVGENRPSGEHLFRAGNREAGTLDNGTELLIYQPILATQIALDETESAGKPTEIGAVVLAMSWKRIDGLKSSLLTLTIVGTVLFVLVSLYLVYLANRNIIRAVLGLSAVVGNIGRGDLSSRAVVACRVSELVSLGDGINRMVEDLQRERVILESAHERLDQVNRDLEQTVKERTRQLTLSMEQLQEQKFELQESEARWRTIIDTEPECVAIIDAHGQLVLMNPAGLEMFGAKSLEQIAGQPVLDAIVPEHRATFADMQRRVLAGEQMTVEIEIFELQGRRRWIEMHAVAIRDKGKTLQLAVTRDVTARRQQEAERLERERVHRNTLVREVHHRIKNNLQSVAGLLQRELGKFQELNPRLETAISQVNVIAVVHGLQGVGPNEVIRLAEVAYSICKTVSGLTMHPVHLITAPEEPALLQVEIKSDEAVSVALVLNELILNAVKHSLNEGPPVTVSLTKEDGAALLLIRNAYKEVPEFNIASGKGLGTGLSLVRSLLPEKGAELTYVLEEPGWIFTRLKLSIPVLAHATA